MTRSEVISVRASQICKSYPTGDSDFFALRPTDFSIPAQSLTCISGASGSGKTTLLSLLGLLENPTSGSIEVSGILTQSLSDSEISRLRAQHFGFVFQAFHLIGSRTSLQNVALGGQYGARPSINLFEQAAQKLNLVGMDHRADAKTHTLSGGEKQRVAISRALMNSPSVLFCDEPTGNLDSINTANVMQLLRRLSDEEGLAIVMVTHNTELLKYADAHFSMKDGHLS